MSLQRIPWRSLLVLFWLTGIVTACRQRSDGWGDTPYVPPTSAWPLVATASPQPIETQAPRATAAPLCQAGLTFLEDVTLPDGTLVARGDSLDKRWKVRNSGTCNWDNHYRLKLIAGPSLGAPQEQMLYPARSGGEATLRIIFTAPLEAGVYRSAWQAYDPDGKPFGDAVFIEIVVP